MRLPGFKITDNKGFHITFRNGVTVSVQFGGGSYCQNYNDNIVPNPEDKTCVNAEIAIWDKTGRWLTKEFRPDINDDVIGWVLPDEVLKALIWAEAYVPKEGGV